MTVAKTFRADAAEQFAPAAKTYRETGNAMHERSAASWGSIAHHAEQTAKKSSSDLPRRELNCDKPTRWQ